MRAHITASGLVLIVVLGGCGAGRPGARGLEEAGEDKQGEPTLSRDEPAGENPVPPEALAAVVEGNNRFALALYARLRTASGNLFLSPFSISSALAMTYGGAAGITRREMAETLRFPEGPEDMHPAFGALIESLDRGSSRGGYRLDVANRLWAQAGYALREEFLGLCARHYGAGAAELDFLQATDESRRTVNRWVEEQTEGRIQDLLPAGSVSPLTRLILTNAIYFKGAWEDPFDPQHTRESRFFLSAEESVEVPFMYQKESLRYASIDDLEILELPYEGQDLSLLVLLPDRAEGLAELEQRLDPGRLESWLASLGYIEVEVFLPRFEITAPLSLRERLKELGMVSAFRQPHPEQPESADFSLMTGARDLYIDNVFHQAYVRVDEAGTEAAAATAPVMGVTSLPMTTVFRADHPFLFLIRDRATGSLLFLGRLARPGG